MSQTIMSLIDFAFGEGGSIDEPVAVLAVHAFSPSPHGHGGERRSHQLDTLFKLIPCCISVSMDFPTRKHGYSRFISWFIKGLLYVASNPWRGSVLGIRNIIRLGCLYDCAQRIVKKYDPKRVLVETTALNLELLHIFNHLGCEVVAFPQNLDAFVPGRPLKKTFFRGIKYELNALKSAVMVAAISHEETVFLRWCGLNAHWLRYKSVVSSLPIGSSVINSIPGRFYLTMGSAFNIPTKQGFDHLMERIAPTLDAVLVVVGRDIQVPSTGNFKNTMILGEVSEADLHALAKAALAILVFQPPTSGALTRIEDLRHYAGGGIIVNYDAWRSAFDFDNVFICADPIVSGCLDRGKASEVIFENSINAFLAVLGKDSQY